MESDAAMTEDLIAYNIIPLDGPSLTNAIVDMPEASVFPFDASLKQLLIISSII